MVVEVVLVAVVALVALPFNNAAAKCIILSSSLVVFDLFAADSMIRDGVR